MAHLSESSKKLSIKQIIIREKLEVAEKTKGFSDVCVIILPSNSHNGTKGNIDGIKEIIKTASNNLGDNTTLITLGEPVDLVHIHATISPLLRYHTWISIKKTGQPENSDKSALPRHHFGALIHTRYSKSLQHVKTRIAYSYCPACDKTTKDYGGKKHTYHHFGTLMSDVWRDITGDLNGDLKEVIDRFADFFGIDLYQELLVLDLRELKLKRKLISLSNRTSADTENEFINSQLLNGDCLEQLRQLPDNSVDFAFTDPPYNLGKKYSGYSDDLAIQEYFEWCDEWINELARVIRPGRTVALLNIPLWTIRHFLHMESVLTFQNWITWDGLAYPVRKLMPAHYSIICFTKGKSRDLPGLAQESEEFHIHNSSQSYHPLEPLAEWFCLRSSCVKKRSMHKLDDRGHLSDLWWDIHRLKHNSRRVDHPTQLPPQLMYRLISVFSKPGEMVLDCFNGAGTTTLTAHQMGRKYLGIELAEKYHYIAIDRHKEIEQEIDPFRKVKRNLTAKNSPVPRMPKRKYEIPKKTLQLEVRRVAIELGKIPKREELIELGKYPIKYYDEYFVSWGEVCAAARTTGMTEDRVSSEDEDENLGPEYKQLRFL